MTWLKSDLKNRFKSELKSGGIRFLWVLRWIGISIVIGIPCGLLGTAFHIVVDFALDLRAENQWILFLAPVGGLTVCGIYYLFRVKYQNTNTIIESVHTHSKISVFLFPAIFLGTAITHLVGGSAGREGAALQMGGSLGNFVGRAFLLKGNGLSIAVLSGMAGYFAAIFGTPLAAAVFAVTIIHIGVTIYEALLPCIVTSVIAFGVAWSLGVPPTRFSIIAPENLELFTAFKCAGLAVLATIVAIIFYKGIHAMGHLAKKLIPNDWIKVAVGGCLVVIMTLIVGSQRYNGVGMDIITQAIENGQANYLDWILKLLFTAVTLGFGFKGGEVVPSFFVGATFGCVVGPLLGLDAGFAAALGLVAVFCAATNSPLASMLLAVEMFGAGGLLYFAIVCVLSFVLSGKESLYSTQRVEELEGMFIPRRPHRDAGELD